MWKILVTQKRENVLDVKLVINTIGYRNPSSRSLEYINWNWSKISKAKCLVEDECLVQAYQNPNFRIGKKFAPVFVGHVHRQPKPSKVRFGFSWFLYFIVITFLISCSTSIKLVIMSSLAWQALETPPEVLCAWRTNDFCKVNSRISLSWR